MGLASQARYYQSIKINSWCILGAARPKYTMKTALTILFDLIERYFDLTNLYVENCIVLFHNDDDFSFGAPFSNVAKRFRNLA